MLWSVAWRNIWRSKVRSLVIICALTIGIFAGVFTWALYEGMVIQRINSAIKTEASHIQLHHKKYLENPDVKYSMNLSTRISEQIDSMAGVKAATVRVIVNSMIASAETGSGVQVVGIDPDKESRVTNMYEKIIDGEYLEGVKRNPILIGKRMAEKLNVNVRSKVVLTMQQMDGEITRAQFKVAGIYKISNGMYEEMTVFVKKSDLINLIGLDRTGSHEIAVLLEDDRTYNDIRDKIAARYKDLDVKSWKELMPEVSLVEETMDISMYLILGIILFALLFGIINTMLMAVLERVKELGMLMAVGMNKIRVFTMIMLETLLLAFTGCIIGIILGYLLTLLLMKTGIDLSAWGDAYERLGYDTVIYPIPDILIAAKVSLMVFVTGLIAAIYPAIKALKLKPAEALRIDI
ncbi:MAG: ABC transporter permease [Bacteroidales bacterium]|nr:MAG: ABC transporter permease [Bacteroidales bacterium]